MIKKIIGNILTVFVLVLVISMSVILLSYNDYKVSEFGDTTLLIVDEDLMEFKSGSILLVDACDPKDVKAGDYVFYYDTSIKPVVSKLTKIDTIYQEEQGEVAFTLPDGYILDGKHIIGKKEDTKEIKKWGTVLSVLTSKWGNLFLVVLPAFILFVYEIINVVIEIKLYKKRKARKEAKSIVNPDDDKEALEAKIAALQKQLEKKNQEEENKKED